MLRLSLLIAILYILQERNYAQKPYADSLKNLLEKSKNKEQKVDLLSQIAYDLYDFDDKAAEQYAHEAYDLANEINYAAGKKYALTINGLGNFSLGNYSEALKNFWASKNIEAKLKPEYVGYNLMLIGSTHRDLAHYDSAEYYYNQAIKTVGEKGDPYYLGFFYRGLANVKLIQWKNQEALQYLKLAEEYALKKPDDFYVLMNIWDLYGRLYEQTLDFEKSDGYFQKMCAQEEKTHDYLQRIKCHLHESTKSYRKGNLPEALDHAFNALQVSNIYRYPLHRIEVYTQIGYLYAEMSQNSLASEYYFEGIKIGERYGLQLETANLYANVAWVYKEELNFKLANEYLDKSESIRKSIGDQHGMAECHNYRGLIFLIQKEYAKALDEFNKAFALRKVFGNELGISSVLYNKSLVYEAQGKNDSALFLQRKALATEEKYNSKLDLGLSYNSLASLMIKLKKYDEALAYLKRAEDLSREIHSKFLLKYVYANYAKQYEQVGDLKKAIRYHSLYESLIDSIYTESGSLKIAEMQALYQVENKERELRELDFQKKVQETELSSQRSITQQQRYIIALSLVSIFILIAAGVVVYRYGQQKTKDNQRLQKLNTDILEQKEEIQAQSEELIEASQIISNINRDLEEKVEARTSELKQAYKELDTFFYRSSHDFRRPITTFLGLAGVAKITVKDPVSLELFDKVNETAENLDKMLQKLQSISDVGAQQMIFKEVFIKELIQEIVDGFKPSIQLKKINVQINVEERFPLVSYPAMLKIILENIIENAIHFCTTENPFVKIKADVNEVQATIEIADNGQGIMDEYKSRIFEMYFRANERSKGNGLGLYIAKKAAEKLNGQIEFTSQVEVGSLFSITIPNHKA
jgi:signal transduction histidine kinase